MDNQSQRMGTESIGKLLVSFSIPTVVATVVTSMYNVVDRIFIGNGVGHEGIAAISICFPIMLIMIAFGMLVGRGGTALLSIKLGEKNTRAAEQILGNAFVLYLAVGLLFTILGLVFLEPMLRLFGASDEVLPMAKEYLSIILWGAILHEISFGLNNYIRAEGSPKVAMGTMVLGACCNVIMDPIFIFGLDMGLKGAALSTILSEAISAAWVVQYYFFGSSMLKIRPANMIPRLDIVRRIAVIGSPVFVMNLIMCLFLALNNHLLVTYGGDIAVSVMGVIFSARMMLMMPLNGLSQGIQPIIGYNYGAKQIQRVKDTLVLSLKAAVLLGVAGLVIIQIGAHEIFRLFDPENKEFIAMGMHAIRINTAMLPLVGFQIIVSNYFQALGNVRSAMLLNLLRQVIVLLPFLVLLPLWLGLDGIWWAAPAANLVGAIITAVMLNREFGRYRGMLAAPVSTPA